MDQVQGIVFALHEEVNPQTGADRLVGIYTSREMAEFWGEKISDRRTFIDEFSVNATPKRR